MSGPSPGSPIDTIGNTFRRSLFLKFILVTLGVGLAANAIVLTAYHRYERSRIIGATASEIATVASRIGRPLVGYLGSGNTGPARDLLAVFAAFPYIICAEVKAEASGATAAWPVSGCARIRRDGEDIHLALQGHGERADLLVRYDQAIVLEGLRSSFLVLAGLAGAGGLAIVIPALATFVWTINRPLARMLSAIRRFEEQEVPQRVDYRSEDEIGRVVQSYNRMLDREVQRVAEIRDAHRSILDSVGYASRIQRGLLPPPARLAARFDDAAVLWEPRDVVGGDIFWISEDGPRTTVAVLDCTGHGVPGAFLTMVAIATLERIVGEGDHPAPAVILGRLHALMRRLLNQDSAEGASNDGLDAAIIRIDPTARTTTFAGARLSLVVARGGKAERIRGDRTSIGYADLPPELTFRERVIPLDETTRLFVATDGIVDQPGGTRRTAFGMDRLMRSLDRHADTALDGVVRAVHAEFRTYAASEPRRDDVTLVALTPRLGQG